MLLHIIFGGRLSVHFVRLDLAVVLLVVVSSFLYIWVRVLLHPFVIVGGDGGELTNHL